LKVGSIEGAACVASSASITPTEINTESSSRTQRQATRRMPPLGDDVQGHIAAEIADFAHLRPETGGVPA
jgi:hypothetical protein